MKTTPCFIATAAILLAASPLARTASLTWDGGVSGTWSDGGTGWLNGVTPATWNNATPDAAIFSGTAPASVSVSTISVGNMTFNSGNYSLSNGTLTLNSSTIDIASGLTTTLSSALSGSTGLTKSGAGTLVLSGTNKNYTGTTTINGGAIQISSAAAGALGSTNNGTVTLNGGALHALFASNTNVNYAINVGASGGELRNLGSDTGRWQMVSNTISGSGVLTLSFGSSNTRFSMGTTTQSGFTGKWIIDSGSNTNRFVDVDGNSNFGGATGDDAITLRNTGTVLVRNGRTLGSVTQGITIGTGGGRINAAGSAAITVAGKISGVAGNTLTLGVENGSVLTLGNALNSYAGDTAIVASAGTTGIVRLGAAGVIPDGASAGNVSIGSGSTLDLNGFSETVNGLSGAGTVNNIVGSSATLSVGSNNATSSFSGNITGSNLALTKVGTGTLSLSGSASNFSGGTTVAAGILQVDNAAALGSGNVVLNSSSGVSGAGNRAQLWLNGINVAGKTLTMNATTNRPVLMATGVSGGTWNGTVTLAGSVGANGNPEFTNNVGNGPLTVAGVVNGSLGAGSLTLRGTSASNTLSASVSIGFTGIEKTDSGTWTISSSGNTWGTTTISQGTILLGASDALPTASNLTMAANSKLDLGSTYSLGGARSGTLGLTGNSTIDFGAAGTGQTMVFGDSSLLSWGSSLLTISNWESGSDLLRFGVNSSGLTAGQLAGINFTGFGAGAQIDSLGYVTPVPEPAAWALLAFGLTVTVILRRKRSRAV